MKPPVSSFPSAAAFEGQSPRRRVEALLRDWLASGRYGAGDRLPTAREISRQCGDVNEQTVRRALKAMMSDGLLRGEQGKGVFVSSTGARHRRVALVLPNLEDETTLLITRGARRVLDEQGFQTLILDARRDSEQEQNHLATLPDLPVDGAIIFPVTYGDIAERILRLKIDGIPLVLVDKHCPGIEVDCVLSDDYDGAYALTAALIAKGYRRIAWLDGEAGSTTVEDRLDGYRWAMGDHGLPVERAVVRRMKLPSPTSPYRDALALEIDALLAMDRRPDALICANDLLAAEALRRLQERGLAVPGDMALAGFDDLTAARESEPGLTTVAKPIEEMGAAAAELFIRRIKNKSTKVERRVAPVRLVLRASA